MACAGHVWGPGTEAWWSWTTFQSLMYKHPLQFWGLSLKCWQIVSLLELAEASEKWVAVTSFFFLIKSILYLCSQSACDRLQVRKRTSHRMHVLIVAFLLSPADSDAHSTTSSASPAQSPCYSNQSDDGSDTEMSAGSSRTPVFSFLDLTYWKR